MVRPFSTVKRELFERINQALEDVTDAERPVLIQDALDYLEDERLDLIEE